MTTRRRAAGSRGAATAGAVMALLVAASAIVAPADPAAAATQTAGLSNITVTNSSGGTTFNVFDPAKVNLDWELPDPATAPAAAQITMPVGATGQPILQLPAGSTFPLRASDGTQIATCTINSSSSLINCPIDAAWLASNPHNVKGSISISGSISGSATPGTQALKFGQFPANTITINSPSAFTNQTNSKYSAQNLSNGEIVWYVTARSPIAPAVYNGGESIVIADQLGGCQAWGTRYWVEQVNDRNAPSGSRWQRSPDSVLTVDRQTDSATISITAQSGVVAYRAVFTTIPRCGEAGSPYLDTAKVNGAPVSGSWTWNSSGGNGAGGGIAIAKSASPSSVSRAGAAVTYSYVVSNTGSTALQNVRVNDPHGGLSAISCPATSLAAGAKMTCTAGYAASQADVDAGSIVDTATAIGTPSGSSTPLTSAPSTATVTATQSPALALAKTASPTAAAKAGDPVTYTFTVTNTGNVTVKGIAVTDPLPGLTAIDCPSGAASLAPGAAVACTAGYTVT